MFQFMPSANHVLYIPGVFLIGMVLGFLLGARAARAELQRKQRQRKA